MPRRSKGARLQLKAARRDESGQITHRATWIIRDNGRDVSTGCAAEEIAAAEAKLRDYIAKATFQTVYGPIKYTDNFNVDHVSYIGQWQNGTFESVNPSKNRKVKPIYPKPPWP